MIDRQSILPLTLGVVFAAMVHLALPAGHVVWAWWGKPGITPSSKAEREPEAPPSKPMEPQRPKSAPTPRREEKKQPEIKIGQKDPSTMTINWISIKGYEQLMARKASFDQAAVQMTVEPVKGAGTPIDPTPPAPPPSPAPARPVASSRPVSPKIPQPKAAASAPVQAPNQRPAVPAQPEGALPTGRRIVRKTAPPGPQVPPNPDPRSVVPERVDAAPGPRNDATQRHQQPGSESGEKAARVVEPKPEPLGQRAVALAVRIEDLLRSVEKTPQRSAAPSAPAAPREANDRDIRPRPAATVLEIPKDAPPVTPSQKVPTTSPRPTAAPKEDREAPPVARLEFAPVRIGSVTAQQGYRLKTVHPRWPPRTTFNFLRGPANPLYRVTFNKAGRVIGVDTLHGTGDEALDAPLYSSIYQWSVEDERGRALPERSVLTVPIQLRED